MAQNHHEHHDHTHGHGVGPAGTTYDLRWLDAMTQHHIGALRMSEFVFDSGSAGVGALARSIWADQANEIKAMAQWRKAWFPEAPAMPVVLRTGGDPDAMADLVPMSVAQRETMQMLGVPPSKATRITWFLESMLEHHGGALQMAHEALRSSSNITVRRLARQIIRAQSVEIKALRSMLMRDGLNKPHYHRYDVLFGR